MLVADASALIKVLTLEDGTEEARLLLSSADAVCAPNYIQLEVASALSKKIRYFGLSREQALASLAAIPEFISEFIPFEPLIASSFDLSLRLRHAMQDCVYLALAVDRNCPLVTSDLKFADRVREAGLADNLITIGSAQ